MDVYDTRAAGTNRPLDHIELGPGAGPELDRRLVGDVARRHLLVVGCGAGHDAVGLARRGAMVTATDSDPDQVAAARHLAAANDVVVTFRQAEPADLAFVPADRMDVALAVHSLGFVADLDRVFRQVHRVLRHAGHFVVALTHPARLNSAADDPDRTVRRWDRPEPVGDRWAHRAEDLVTALHRANFEIDTLLERHGDSGGLHPVLLIARGAKIGS